MHTLNDLVDLIQGQKAVVLTGAGCSTESGIPDYRGPLTRKKARNPILYKAFVNEASARVRYWSRSLIGWSRVQQAVPNPAHTAIAELEAKGFINGVITQNVDRLHHKAGSERVVELHGTLSEVFCLDCGEVEQRKTFQQRLEVLNPDWSYAGDDIAPDGDVELGDIDVSHFRVPACSLCGGVLKPNVVFFGESVPKKRVEDAWRLYNEANMILVVGSSLTVFSGYRFVLKAAKEGRPIAIVNLGPTRGDAHASCCLDQEAGMIMPGLLNQLINSGGSVQQVIST